MTTHLITAHKGEPHIASSDARKRDIAICGKGRNVVNGMALSVPNNNTLHVDAGMAFIDGSWFAVDEGGEDIRIEYNDSLMNRRDLVVIRYWVDSDHIEDAQFVVIPGTPVKGNAALPSIEHPGDISAGDPIVDIPFCEVPIMGTMVGRPTSKLLGRVLNPPTQQCATCEALVRQAQQVLADCSATELRSRELIRDMRAQNQQMREQMAAWAEKMLRLDQYEQELAAFGAILANNAGTFMIMGPSLVIPAGWIDYDAANHMAEVQYAELDGHDLSLQRAPMVSGGIAANAANIDYLLMLNGEE